MNAPARITGNLPSLRQADAQSSAHEAQQRAERIRSGMYVLVEWEADVIAAYASRDWVSLGYASWEAYLDGEFGEHRIKLPRGQRRVIVAGMSAENMSTRAIAAAMGVDQKTIVNDRRAGEEISSPAQSEMPAFTVDEAADLLDVSPDQVRRAAEIQRQSPEVADRVRRGELDLDEAEQASGSKPITGTDGKTYRQSTSQRAPSKPRTDVVSTVSRALLRAQEAARAADQITRQHLAGRNEEAATWSRSLSTSMKSLQRLMDQLTEAQS